MTKESPNTGNPQSHRLSSSTSSQALRLVQLPEEIAVVVEPYFRNSTSMKKATSQAISKNRSSYFSATETTPTPRRQRTRACGSGMGQNDQ